MDEEATYYKANSESGSSRNPNTVRELRERKDDPGDLCEYCNGLDVWTVNK